MGAKKKQTTTQVVETPRVEWECYTFTSNVSIWSDVYGIGERVMLTKDDMLMYWPYVVLTSEYKWPKMNSATSKWCGC
jgi:hypothetical protein